MRIPATLACCTLLAGGLGLALWPDGATSPTEAAEGELDCLALTLYWEAGDQGRDGMEAVAAVVLNRLEHPEFPDTICGVVEDGGETPPCQFNWWCDGKSDRPVDAGQWALARTLAEEVVSDPPDDPTGSALFFHASGVETPWRDRQRTATIGDHVFYR